MEHYPCGKWDKCKSAPGCGDCNQFNAYRRYLTICEVEKQLSEGKSLEQQKEETVSEIYEDDPEERNNGIICFACENGLYKWAEPEIANFSLRKMVCENCGSETTLEELCNSKEEK